MSQGLAKATALGAAVTASSMVLSLVRGKVSAIVLGPAGLGDVATLTQWMQFFAVGTGTVTGAALIASVGEPDDTKLPGVLRTAAMLVTAICGVALVAALPASQLITTGVDAPHTIIGLSAATTWLTTLAQIPQALLIAQQHLRRLSVLSVASTGINTVALIAGTIAGGIEGQFLGGAVGALTSFAVSWRWGMQIPVGRVVGGQFDFEFARRAVTLGSTSLIAATCLQGALVSIRASLDRIDGAAANGLFQAAWSLNAVVFSAVTGGLSNYAFPRFAAAKTREALEREIDSALQFALKTTPPIALLGVALHEVLVPLLFSAKFAPTLPLIGLLIVGNVPRAAAWVLGGPLMYRGHSKHYLALELAAAVMLGAGGPALVGRWGLVAMGAAYVANATAQVALTTLALRHTEGVRVRSTRLLALAAAMGLVAGSMALSARSVWVNAVVGLGGAVWLLLVMYEIITTRGVPPRLANEGTVG